MSQYDVDAVLRALVEAVQQHFNLRAEPVTGAALAERLRDRLPNFEFGQDPAYPRLSDYVREGEERRQLARVTGVHHLEVVPYAELASWSGRRGSRSGAPESTYQRLRPDLWRAFLDSVSHVDLVYNPETDRVERSELTQATNPVSIPRIDAETQQTWMREFSERYSAMSREILERLLAEPRWFDAFPQYLKRSRPDLIRVWAQERLFRVRAALERWKSQSELEQLCIFDAPREIESETASRTEVQGALTKTEPNSVKQLLLRAIADMPLAELQELPIPFKYLRPHIQPRDEL